MIASLILPLLLQVGPNPQTGAIPDYSAEVQDRPPRELSEPVGERIAPTWLEECFSLVDSDPARAHVKAQLQRDSTSGADRILANHCLGLAATALERWDEAQLAFLTARNEAPEDDRAFRARLGAMAANAVLPTGDVESALSLLDQAEADARASGSGDLVALTGMDRARVLVTLGRLDEAEVYLAEAVQLRPSDPEASLLLATLLRRLNRLAEAQSVIANVIDRVATDPAIGLEAGVIAALESRDADAREAWQSVIAMHPESAQAESARGYLDQLGPATPAE